MAAADGANPSAADAEAAQAAAKALKKKLKKERQKANRRARATESQGEPSADAAAEPEPAAEAEPPAEVDEAEAQRRREANRKKRERAKAKKRQAAAAAAQASAVDASMVLRAERRDAGAGRGQGMFATEAVPQGDVVARVRPAISVVFDQQAPHVCGYCFAVGPECVSPARSPSAAVRSRSPPRRRSAQIQACSKCNRFSICAACRGCEGREAWHQHECEAFVKLPPGAKKGDTSTLRLLLRHKATAEQGEWCGANAAAAGKEDFALLKTLQGNPASVPAQALLQLSLLTGVAKETAEELIYQIRTNAASLDRGGKAGCALCCHMGYTNHDCEPNTAAAIDAQGYVRLTALRAMAPGDEVLISYIDQRLNVDERRQVLESHYGFSCGCARCKADLRKKLRGGARALRAEGTGRALR